MRYTIDNNSLAQISLIEEDYASEILQNICLILATRKGTIPMYRDFGMSQAYVDRPGPVAQSLIATELAEELERYEPRAKLIGINLDLDTSGSAIIEVEVEIEDE